jgi:Fe-S cluster assembly iron-binding protein IscA
MTCQSKESCAIPSAKNKFIEEAQEKLNNMQCEFTVHHPVFLTDLAWKRLNLFFDQEKFFRLNIEKKGCAGHGFFWNQDHQKTTYDLVVHYPLDPLLYFILDKRIIFYCLGLMIDFCQHPLYSKFIFLHKKAKGCGCHSSFSF